MVRTAFFTGFTILILLSDPGKIFVWQGYRSTRMTQTVSYIYMAAAMGAVAVGVLVLLRFRRARPYYPFLFAVFPVVSFAGRNFGFVYWVDCLLAVAAIGTGTLVVWLAVRVFFREKERRALFALSFVGVFWGAAPGIDGFRSLFGFEAKFSTVQLILIAFPLGAASLGYLFWLRKTEQSFVVATQFLWTASVIAIAIPMATIGFERFRPTVLDAMDGGTADRSDQTDQTDRTDRTDIQGQDESAMYPDIVLIVLDMYGREDTLAKYYDYDNGPFIEELEKRGFYVARESYANYNFTRRAMPSLLNFMYMEEDSAQRGGAVAFSALVRENRIVTYLRQRGYEFVATASGWEPSQFRTADRYLSSRRMDVAFFRRLIDKTALRFVLNRLRDRQGPQEHKRHYDFHRDQIRSTFELLKSLEGRGKPMFVIAHVMSPHDPFVFDASGGAVYPDMRYLPGPMPMWEVSDAKDYLTGYRDQVQAVNGMLLASIDAILQRAPDTVILVQGDHGPRLNRIQGYPEGRWEDYVDEELAILNAYRLPGLDQESVLYPGISPVNSFRVVLNGYFGESFELLEDRSYMVEWESQRVEEVTALLKAKGSSAARR